MVYTQYRRQGLQIRKKMLLLLLLQSKVGCAWAHPTFRGGVAGRNRPARGRSKDVKRLKRGRIPPPGEKEI